MIKWWGVHRVWRGQAVCSCAYVARIWMCYCANLIYIECLSLKVGLGNHCDYYRHPMLCCCPIRCWSISLQTCLCSISGRHCQTLLDSWRFRQRQTALCWLAQGCRRGRCVCLTFIFALTFEPVRSCAHVRLEMMEGNSWLERMLPHMQLPQQSESRAADALPPLHALLLHLWI